MGNQNTQKPSNFPNALAFCTLPPANQTDKTHAVRTFTFLQRSAGVAGQIVGKKLRYSFLARGFTSPDIRCFE